jgi:membrane protein implicated in regulation of membrane protease activity
VFVVLGVILLLTTRNVLEKYLKPKSIKTNLDRVVGMNALVTEDIDKFNVGEVKVDGKKWSAISNQKIVRGEEVIVEKIDGVKLIVKKRGEE